MSRFQANSANNTLKICEILSRASIEQPRPQVHRPPCQCTATPETQAEKNRNCGHLSLFTTRKNSVDEPRRQTDSVQDCRTCLCMITGRRSLHVEKKARRLVHCPHVPCSSHAPAATTAAVSPPAPPQYRPDGAAFPLPRQPRVLEVPRPAGSHRSVAPRYCMGPQRATHSTSILKTKPVIRQPWRRKGP